ncbi:MAG: alcohol dehydrogenase catalytic domain-containing protein, partial [Clostridia bacterium]|nr:alcohol dehydrogenase catalytic domain-containing protein [Clostridia bacterium]
MRQLILTGVQKIETKEVPLPEVKPGWVLIKTARCGICGTDAHGYMGETIFGKVFPFHLGHEVCGYVEKVGNDDSHFKTGDLVVINPFFTCDSCPACFMGQSNNCSTKTTIGLKGPGGFSEYILVPETSTYKADKDMDVDRLTIAEPLANVIYAMDKIKIDSSMNVLINGVGAIGLMFLQLVAGYKPKSITVTDLNDAKLEKAKKIGADITINARSNTDPNDHLYDVIIDCTSSAECVGQSIKKLAFGGQFLNFGVCKMDATFEVNPFDLYKKDATYLSSFALNKSSMQKALDLLI